MRYYGGVFTVLKMVVQNAIDGILDMATVAGTLEVAMPSELRA